MGKKLINDKANGLHVSIDNLPELYASLKDLAANEVLVGVPEENTNRENPLEAKAGITNASLAYIHDNGAPEARIPARPFMLPGMTAVLPKATETLGKAAQYALRAGRVPAENRAKVNEGLERVGLMAVSSIRAVIGEGIPPPLSEMTLRKRAAKGRKGAAYELERRAKGLAPQMLLALPLIDTGEMRKSITYVVRPRSARKK